MIMPVLTLWILAAALTATTGCRDELSTADLELAATDSKPVEQDHFETAVDFSKCAMNIISNDREDKRIIT